MANYPDEIYTPRTKENDEGVSYDETKTTRLFAEDLNFLDDEVVAIQQELGLNPSGEKANIKEAIKDLVEKTIKERLIRQPPILLSDFTTGMNIAVEGSGSASPGKLRSVIRTGDESGSSALLATQGSEWVSQYNLYAFSSKTIVNSVTSDLEFWFGLLPDNSADPNQSQAHIAIINKNGDLYASCGDGTNYTEVQIGSTSQYQHDYFLVDYNAPGSIRFLHDSYGVDFQEVANIETNVPDGGAGMHLGGFVKNNTADAREVEIVGPKIAESH